MNISGRPEWAGVALSFGDGKIIAIQMVHPDGFIEITQQFERFESWSSPELRMIPRDSHADVRLSGRLMAWDPRSSIYRPQSIEEATRPITAPRKEIEE